MPDASKRVAVIAIHGVGYHESGASAEMVTDLLEGVQASGAAGSAHSYGSFAPQEVQIALPPPICKDKVKRKFEYSLSAMEERRGNFRDLSSIKKWFGPGASAMRSSVPDVATEFMDSLLQNYTGDPEKNSYTTWRRVGRRTTKVDGEDRLTDVDVYDMHWADLARPSNSVLRFIFSFYQLLLHLASLGRMAQDHAAMENFGGVAWFLYSRSYLYATRVLTLFIVQLTVLIFGLAVSPLPLLLDVKTTGPIAAGAVVALAAIVVLVLLALRVEAPSPAKSWWFGLIPAFALGLFTWRALSCDGGATALTLLLEWWAIGAGICILIFLQYDKVRAGSREFGYIFIGTLTILLGVLVLQQGSLATESLRTAIFYLVQYTFLALRFLWMLFFFLAVFAFLMELLCRAQLRLQKGKVEELARVRAAARTARFALAVPSVLILLLAVFTGSITFHALSRQSSLYAGVKPAVLPKFITTTVALDARQTDELLACVENACAEQNRSAEKDPNQFLEGLVVQSPPLGMGVSAGLAGLCVLLLALMAIPSVYYEIFPERSKPNKLSACLGSWLSGGYHHFHWVISFLWVGAVAIPFGIFAYSLVHFWRSGLTGSFLLYLYEHFGMLLAARSLLHWGGILVGSGAVILGLVVKNFSAVLDAILDVDTYLRTSPVEATPRAQIVERYVALLGHIHARRNPDRTHYYSHVIIVAHSLGSNITADMLRFLNKCGHPKHTTIDTRRYESYLHFAFDGEPQGSLPMYFFSMGCPLRQLLNRFFPHLYKWIREAPEDSGGDPAKMEPGDPIPPDTKPAPADLRVAQWANFYRSGDYIGRSVWSNHVMQRTNGNGSCGGYPDPLLTNSDSSPATGGRAHRIDACIGLGAHTHYWDRTAPDVGEQLDKMIAY
ncbi:MAG TPA: hypothetical protein VKT53_08355 [Candidatus Acidoferrum sp.]|nr:hypothetical protein [Candidatus Acidoferrum sp.]